MHKKILVTFLLTLLSSSFSWPLSSSHAKSPHGIILISLDTLRADHLGIYGYHRNTSPAIDAFARESIIFENAVVQSPWTLSSHMSIMTSLYPASHGVVSPDRRLADKHKTLAELLKGGGYRTAGFTDGMLLLPRFGFNQGFDIYRSRRVGIAKIIPKVNAWLEKNKTNKFFLFIHCYDIHSPYYPPPPYNYIFHDFDYTGSMIPSDKKLLLTIKGALQPTNEDIRHFVALYDGGIGYTDEIIGGFLSHLHEVGLYDESLIIITSDHGEEFLEHGSLLHRQLYYRPNLHVPLIIHLPGYPKRKIKEFVQSIDLLPTILDIAELPPHANAQGRSLLPLIKQHKNVFYSLLLKALYPFKKDSHALFAENYKYYDYTYSVIRDGYQMIFNLKTGATLLFDLKADPLLQNNIAGVQTGITKKLLDELRSNYSMESRYSAVKSNLDDHTREQLKALGYIEPTEAKLPYDEITDWDHDGVQNNKDNCPWAVNTKQKDRDGDGVGDVCDNCRLMRNHTQEDIDEDKIGDVCDRCTDADWDGYGNPGFPNSSCDEDNCPFIFNPRQKDSDGNGIGDICENHTD